MTTSRQSEQVGKTVSMERYPMDVQRALSIALAETDDLAEGLILCLEACLQISGMDCGGIYLFSDTTETLDLIVHKGLKQEFVKTIAQISIM